MFFGKKVRYLINNDYNKITVTRIVRTKLVELFHKKLNKTFNQ